MSENFWYIQDYSIITHYKSVKISIYWQQKDNGNCIACTDMSNAYYVTLGQGRKSIFKHRGIIFREFVVSWSWNTLLRQHVQAKNFFLNCAIWRILECLMTLL